MQVMVNGETRSLVPAPSSVNELLTALGLPLERVAVEQNGRIVKRDERAKTPVANGDVFEIVTLVGGG